MTLLRMLSSDFDLAFGMYIHVTGHGEGASMMRCLEQLTEPRSSGRPFGFGQQCIPLAANSPK